MTLGFLQHRLFPAGVICVISERSLDKVWTTSHLVKSIIKRAKPTSTPLAKGLPLLRFLHKLPVLPDRVIASGRYHLTDLRRAAVVIDGKLFQ